MRRQTAWLSLVWIVGLATAACGAVGGPTPTATLTVLPLPPATRPPTEAPPTSTPLPSPGNIRPPTADLTISGQAQTSAIGTYCWRNLDAAGSGVGLCADMIGIMTPAQPLRVPAGPFIAEFSLPLDTPPTSAALWVYPATGPASPISGTDTLAWQPPLRDPTTVPLEFNPSVSLDLDDGVYVVALFAQWQDVGDVMYGFLVQVGDPPPAATPVTETLPASCLPASEAETAFVDPGGRYCLLYPSTFHTGDLTDDRANFYGPPLDASVEPIFATLTIEALGTDGGKPLSAVVETYLFGANPEGAAPPLDRQPGQWGGEPAEVINGLPGLQPSRQVIVIHAGTVYHVVLLPYDVSAPPALPDVENVWAVVSQSFAFLPAP